MQIITTKTKVYNFEELSIEAQEKVIEDNRDINTDYDWWEFTIDDSKSNLEELGYTEPKIYFSGFWSQGDGASFEAQVDLTKWLKAHKLANKYRALYYHASEYSISITKNGFYEHEYTMNIECDYVGDYVSEISRQQYDIVENIILEDARSEARKIYRTLEKEYEALSSDEAIKDTILANEYQFTESGKIF